MLPSIKAFINNVECMVDNLFRKTMKCPMVFVVFECFIPVLLFIWVIRCQSFS